ncbi:MAG: hypothetical protein K0U41_02060 [Gammaproteobacteria bacterium]|nr:hypothetical protein [Gammaproteobacteria bacterium]
MTNLVVQIKTEQEYQDILSATRAAVQGFLNAFQLQHEKVAGLKVEVIKHNMSQIVDDCMSEELLITMKGNFYNTQQIIGSTKLLTGLATVIGNISSLDMRMKDGETSISLVFPSIEDRK